MHKKEKSITRFLDSFIPTKKQKESANPPDPPQQKKIIVYKKETEKTKKKKEIIILKNPLIIHTKICDNNICNEIPQVNFKEDKIYTNFITTS